MAGLASISELCGDEGRFARLLGTITAYRGVGVFTLAKDIDWLPKAEECIKRDPKLRAGERDYQVLPLSLPTDEIKSLRDSELPKAISQYSSFNI